MGLTRRDLLATAAGVGVLPAGVDAIATTANGKFPERVSVLDFMTAAEIADVTAGTASLDVTASIHAAIAANPHVLEFPFGVYKTTGFNIPANSSIREIRGIGRPILRRAGQGVIATNTNLFILSTYNNKLTIRGFVFEGRGRSFTVPQPRSTTPPDRTWYADITVNTAQGSADEAADTDNFVLITDNYFLDAPGSSVAGSKAQSIIVTGNKFDGWNDHAIYYSGSSALSDNNIVSNNVFWQTRYSGGVAVKVRNRVSRFVASGNVLNVGGGTAFAVDQGNAAGSHYKPTSIAILGNAVHCGNFLSMGTAFTVQNPSDVVAVVVANNNVQSDSNLFYLADTASEAWAAHLLIADNVFANISGTWKTMLDVRFIGSAHENSIICQGNVLHDYGLAQIAGTWPQTLRVVDNRFNRTHASFLYATGSDDTTAKVFEFLDNHVVHDTNTGKGAFLISIGTNSTVSIKGNYLKNNAQLCSLQSTPARIEISTNVLEDSTGVVIGSAFYTLNPRGSAGEFFLERNKCISSSGASTPPRLLDENTATPHNSLLASYNVFAIENYFRNVAAGLRCIGTAVTTYAGPNKIYGVNNYGAGSTFDVRYNAVTHKASELPTIAI